MQSISERKSEGYPVGRVDVVGLDQVAAEPRLQGEGDLSIHIANDGFTVLSDGVDLAEEILRRVNRGEMR
jgi:hypothetical protein